MSKMCDIGIGEMTRGLESGAFTSEALIREVLSQVERDQALNIWLELKPSDVLLAEAKTSDERRSEGKALGPLDGVPIGIKDNINVRGLKTQCASKLLEGYRPPFNATVVEKLLAQGAILVGKLNMDEFAMGSSNEYSAYGGVKNPWDLTRVPGGSSGGSAAAVAARHVPGALGTDTGGSIRQPASFCGVVGLKPTYSAVSRYGVVAFASSLDQVGPLARTVADVETLFEALRGEDPLDSTSQELPHSDSAPSKGHLRVGVPEEYFGEGLSDEVRGALEQAKAVWQQFDVEFVPINLPHTHYGIATYYLIATAEASSNLSRFDGIRYGQRASDARTLEEVYEETRGRGFGKEVKRRIMLGTFVLSSGYYDAYYKKAQKVRTLICQDFDKAFETVDAILTPTTPSTAFRAGDNLKDPLSMYLADVCTINCNLAGLPGLSIPCGFDSAGLPIGMQLLGKPFGEATLFELGKRYENATQWTERRPS
ncbi:MAG: Asp-tRNA(Asn)/Glu-tRNA(Gln) amidotransferase subunit GatA [Myxococcota bacterium]|nr:Asp-tRNA(Asn)/Glu-tRNA(Gln) amidotransferase subunit GatA [Myxococcota bacterium]